MAPIPRAYDNLIERANPDKVLVVYGSRQVGKTTLVQSVVASGGMRIKYDTGDDVRIQEVWRSHDLDRLRDFLHGYQVAIIDEAQRIPDIGISLKMVVDARLPVQLIVTGSVSFERSGQIGEPLTGRKTTLLFYPVAILELAKLCNRHELDQRLGEYLIFGSYLLKDILELERVKSSKVLLDLLRLLAFQVGNEVSLRELGGRRKSSAPKSFREAYPEASYDVIDRGSYLDFIT